MLDNFEKFLKSLMQPAITAAALYLLIKYTATPAVNWDEILFIAKVVLFFWFGYTAVKKFSYLNGSESSATTTLQDIKTTVTDTVKGLLSTGVNAQRSFDAPVEPEPVKIYAPAVVAKEIQEDDEPEDITGLAMKFKDKMLYLWGDMTPKQREGYLDYAISLAKAAWDEFIGKVINKPVPESYKQMEPENLYYGRLKKACGDKWNPTASRGAIDVLHDLLKFKQTGEW